MSLETGVNVGTLMLALGVMLVTSGAAWGLLLQRVNALEKEVQALSGFADRLARIEENLKNVKEGVGEIKSRLEQPHFAPPPPPPRRTQ